MHHKGVKISPLRSLDRLLQPSLRIRGSRLSQIGRRCAHSWRPMRQERRYLLHATAWVAVPLQAALAVSTPSTPSLSSSDHGQLPPIESVRTEIYSWAVFDEAERTDSTWQGTGGQKRMGRALGPSDRAFWQSGLDGCFSPSTWCEPISWVQASS